MQIDWRNITSLAYQTIIENKINSLPIEQNKVKCKGAKICSYQRYSKKTGVPIDKISCNSELGDAYIVKGLRPNLILILYNNAGYKQRVKHSLFHEIGHIKCNHSKQGDKEELEAHFFASQINAPNILVKELAQRGYTVNEDLFIKQFELSRESARKKLEYFKKYSFHYCNEHDDILLLQFNSFLNEKFPIKNKSYNDDYYDDLERERQNWN